MPRRKKEEEEEVYHVEVITKARVSDEGDWEYLVKWAGYDSDADSWEPTENVKQCERLLASFWKHVGMDNEDYPIGYEVAAEEDWINDEKRYFSRTIKPPKRGSSKTTKKDKGQKKNKSKSRSNTSRLSENSTDDAQTSDEAPLPKTPVTRARKKIHVLDSDSEPGSDHSRMEDAVPAPPPKAATPSPKVAFKIPKVKRQEPHLASSGSVSIAPPKVAAMRTHQDQRNNPLVKTVIPPPKIAAGSSLLVKQRLATGVVPPPTVQKPLPTVTKKPLPPLSFKKNKPPIIAPSHAEDTTNMSAPTPTSSVVYSDDVTDNMEVVSSPPPMDVDKPTNLFNFIFDDAGPLAESSSDKIAVPVSPKSHELSLAEQFLKTVHIPEHNTPMMETALSDQSTTALAKTLGIPKIPKKWKWSGDLFISTSEDKTVLLCAIIISDPTGTSNSSYINLLLSSLDTLKISKLYPIMDLSFILQACGKPQYFGRLDSSEPDGDAIYGLKHHLAFEGLVAVVSLLLEGAPVAVLAIFSEVQQNLIKKLEVPEQLLAGSTLLVALLPFSISVKTSTKAAGWRSMETMLPFPQVFQDAYHHSQEAMVHQGMSLLCFPRSLLEFLNTPSKGKGFCIWPLADEGFDTVMLKCILKTTKATLAMPEDDLRVAFISNRHLGALHSMQSLVTKRILSSEVQFWSYGYSSNMESERWRVQEIYPLGGLVTFTASALVEDLLGCKKLMSQIIEHPLWDCYILPEVLATSYQLCTQGNSDPSSVSPLDALLHLATSGSIPVARMSDEKGATKLTTWLLQGFNYFNISGYNLLEACLKALRSNPHILGMVPQQLAIFMNKEITKDLLNIQIQPVFMRNYRRFVVVRAPSESAIPPLNDGLEWLTSSSFSFRDDYF